ncbi:MAG: hypothetical protein JXA72_02370 [Bacteroidales bacterium]|nr:hypothetical protein [Bacteroidales bacterium]
MKQLLIGVCLLITNCGFSQYSTVVADTIQIHSELLTENRNIIVFRSPQASQGDSVHLIYLIDGEYAGYRVQQLKDHYGDSLSNWIVVGIVNTDRRRDLLYVNDAAQFLDFITQELIPVVEKDYKINKRILYGHSFGGSFTVYAMLHEPGYFDGYIASSPTPIMDLVNEESYLQMDSTSQNRISFYFSCGSRDMKQVRKWTLKLSDNLAGLSFNKMDWQYQVLQGKDHNSSDVTALINGLKYLK